MSDKVWYYKIENKSVGPYTLETFTELIMASVISETTLVWKEDASDWATANSMPEFSHLFSKKALPLSALSNQSTGTSDDLMQEEQPPSSQNKNMEKVEKNYLLRHWNGEFSLAWAWWVNGALFNVILMILDSILTDAAILENPWIGLAYMILFLIVYVWQIIGIYRSAENYVYEAQGQLPRKSVFWARAAQVMLVLGLIGTVDSYAPLIQDSVSLALLESSDMSQRYFIEYAGTTDVQLTGYINRKSVAAVMDAFSSDADRTALVIDSPGGILVDAFRLADFIVENGLIVGITDSCVSACVLLLAASPNSLASPSAELIFHRPVERADFSSPELQAGMLVETLEYYNRFEQYGVPAASIERFKENEFTPISLGEAYESGIIDSIWEEAASIFHDPSELCQRVDCFQVPVVISYIEPISMNVFSLEAGICFDDGDDNDADYTNIYPISCEDSHDNEVISTFELTIDEYPSSEKLDEIAIDECLGRFESYIGLDYDASIIALFPISPNSIAWAQGQRKVSCIGYNMNLEKLESSLKNSQI